MIPVDLLKALETIGDAPEGIERLRDMIRQLAIEGGLSSRFRDDEPAATLLAKVRAEKQRLVRTGEIRKSRALPKEDPGSSFGQLPEGWSGAWLADCVPYDLTDGDWVESKDQDPSGNIRLTQLADVGVGTFKDVSARFLNQETADRLRCTPLSVGDVLIARLPRPLGRACLFPGSHQTCVTVVDVAIARPGRCSVFPAFMVLTLNAPETRERIATLATGTTRQRVSTGNLRKLPVRVPPLEEQRRIVAKVDELMALLDELERARDERDDRRAAFRDSALAALQNAEDADTAHAAWSRIAANLADCITDPADIAPLRQTILQLAVRGRLVPQDPRDEPASELVAQPLEPEAVPNASPLPAGWCYARFGSFGEVHGGSTPSKNNSAFWGGGVPWVTPKDMKREVIAESIDTLTDRALADTTIRMVPPESLIMVVRGMILSHSFPTARTGAPVTLNQDMKAIVLADKRLLPYLHLATRGLKARFLDLVERSTHGTCKLKSERLFEELIPLPPLAEQGRIIEKADELMVICDELEQGLVEAKAHQAAFAAAAVHHLDLGRAAPSEVQHELVAVPE